MPELPEVETARRVLEDGALHRRIADVDDTDTFVCRPHRPGDIRRALLGRELTAARRRGKSLWLPTSAVDPSGTPGPDLGLHLGMSGVIVVTTAPGDGADAANLVGGDTKNRQAAATRTGWQRFRLTFQDGGRLALIDARRLSRVRLDPEIAALGPDALGITPAVFRSAMGHGSSPVKARLLDQAAVAGVGNLLADETLWLAKINPATRVNALDRTEVDRLGRALRRALRSATDKGGVHTGAVIAARLPGGRCPRCHAEMRHATVGGRSTWWCSREQAGRP